jgi:DNA-binding transcriptional ArsR family regulator
VALPHPLPEPLVEVIARRFRILGEPTRIRIVDALRDGEASVQELTETLELTQQNVSKHLGILLEAGIVARRREGNFAVYSIADRTVLKLCEHVCGSVRRQLDELESLLVGVGR